MNTTQHQDVDRSQLFLVRMWTEQGSEGSVDNKGQGVNHHAKKEWHGRVQHIVSGEAHTFHDWRALVDLMLAMLPADRVEHPEGLDGSGGDTDGKIIV